jgi:glycosyltransferase involved in cell wall biosynthesis
LNDKLRLGLVFSYREGWIGGSYYLLNLLSALKQVLPEDRPEITVLGYAESDFEPVRALDYPEISYRVMSEHKPGAVLGFGNRISQKLIGRPLRYPPALDEEIDILYPAATHPRYRRIPHKLFWIPDFQEEYLPEMFGPERVANRRRVRGRVARLAREIVFSSQDAARDFRRFYPDSRARAHVLSFAVTHPDLSQVDIDQLRRRYELGQRRLFLVSNQFWKHKNHKVVLEALHVLACDGQQDDFLICFSGKEEDSRNPGYVGEIRAIVQQYGLQEQVRFLGFMDRADQLRLMQTAVAVIQPSLFEGWSTVIEDAKALGVPVIASDLPVHAEQLGPEGVFFARKDARELARKILLALNGQIAEGAAPGAYTGSVRAFGEQFVEILAKITKPAERGPIAASGSEL